MTPEPACPPQPAPWIPDRWSWIGRLPGVGPTLLRVRDRVLASPLLTGPRRAALASRIYMAASLIIRMVVNLGVLVLIARGLGPTEFGFISTVFAYAGFAGLVTDFGFSVKTLRDIGAEPHRGASLLAASLSVKSLLTIPVVLAGLAAIAILPLPNASRIAGAMLGAGVLIGSIGELALVGYRSLNRFADETRLVLWTSVIYAAVIGVIMLSHGGVVMIGLGFLATRIGFALAAIHGARKLFPGQPITMSGGRQILASLRGSVTWAVDNGINYLNAQIDSLVVVAVLGLTAAGIYQAGGRFVLAALAMGAVLTNVHIPALSAEAGSVRMSPRERRMILEFLGVGGLFALFFVVCGPLLTHFLLGDKFAAVNVLWPGFGAFLIARYLAAAFGAALAAQGRPALRIAGQVAGIVTISVGFWLTLPRFGLLAAPWIMALGGVATTAIYAWGRLSPGFNRQVDDPEI